MILEVLTHRTFAKRMGLNPDYVRQIAKKHYDEGNPYKGWRFIRLGAGRGEWYAYPEDVEIRVL